MAKLASLRINLDKIDKSKIYKGEKGNYITLTVSINDEPDQFGNSLSAWVEQSKGERQSKEQKNYLGNGKVFWSDDNAQAVTTSASVDQDDDLPF